MAGLDARQDLEKLRDHLLDLFVQQDEALAADDQPRLDRLKIEVETARSQLQAFKKSEGG